MLPSLLHKVCVCVWSGPPFESRAILRVLQAFAFSPHTPLLSVLSQVDLCPTVGQSRGRWGPMCASNLCFPQNSSWLLLAQIGGVGKAPTQQQTKTLCLLKVVYRAYTDGQATFVFLKMEFVTDAIYCLCVVAWSTPRPVCLSDNYFSSIYKSQCLVTLFSFH